MNTIYLLSPFHEEKFIAGNNSLEYIKYYLKDNGYASEIIDCSFYPKDLNEVISKINKNKRPIIGITAYTRLRFSAYELIKKVRKEIPESTIVVGGRHFGFLAEETLCELPEVDAVVRGEGEITFKEICDAIFQQTGFDNILGVSFKKNGRIIHNEERPLERDINKFRSYEKSDINESEKDACTSTTKGDKRHRYFPIYATRGCPNSCVFCSLTSSIVRFRNIENIIQEIEDKIDIFGTRYVMFGDSSLTLNKKFIVKLCEEVIKRKLNIRWNCYTRADIDTEILKIMRKAGLESAEIALESGSPRILKSIKKNINLEQFEKVCQAAHALGIKLYAFCLISLPDEKKEDADLTISLLKKISPYITAAGIQTARIMPDAALYGIALQRGLLSKDFSWFKPYSENHSGEIANPLYDNIPFYFEHLGQDDIAEKIDEFNRVCLKNFSNFGVIKRAIRNNLNIKLLRAMSAKDIRRKVARFTSMFLGAIKNLLQRFSLLRKKNNL